MRTIDAVYGKPIPLSKTGTNNTTTVRFDVKAWLDAYPDCLITLIHKRPTDPTGLPVMVLPVENGKALWLVSNADTHFAGTGECELEMNRGEEDAKSVTYITEISESVGSQEEDPPEPYQGFVDYVVQKASEATTAKNDAESARDEAIEAVEGVEEAKDIAIEAKNDAVEAKNDAVSAKEDAIDAKEDAEVASETAISAKNDAVSAKDDAVSAKNDAVTAKNDAVSAKTAAETAKTGAEVAQTAAETAQSAAETAQAAAEAAAEEAEETLSSKMDKANPVGTGKSSFGGSNTVTGANAFAEGNGTTASGDGSHAEGGGSKAQGLYSHAEGSGTTASGQSSHSEGGGATASGAWSHAEGGVTIASDDYAHAEGFESQAQEQYSHAEGYQTVASGMASHAEGYGTKSQGMGSHAEGIGTIANNSGQHVSGRYNSTPQTSGSGLAEIVGNGVMDTSRSNARTLDYDGNEELAGDLKINACGGANPVQVGTKLSSHDSSIATLNTSVVSLNQAIDSLDERIDVGSSTEEITSTGNIRNGYYTANGQTWYNYNESWTSDKIPVSAGDVIIATGKVAEGIAFVIGFDDEENPTVYDVGTETKVLTKEYTIEGNITSISVTSVYTNNLKVLNKKYINVKDYVDEKVETTAISTDDVVLKNIVDSTSVENKYIDSNGHVYAYANSRVTGYIDINVCDKAFYTGNASDSGIVCWIAYDADKNVVDRLVGSETTSNVKNYEIDVKQIRIDNPTAKYIRFCSVYSTNIAVSGLCKPTASELVSMIKSMNVLFGKKYVACGDSFTEGLFGSGYEEYYDTVRQMWKTYPWYIAERNNMMLVNEAKSGTTMVNGSVANAFSVNRYKAIPEDADYITLMFGLNETGMTVGTLSDTTNATIMGAWNVVLEYLIEHHPYAKIGIILADSWLSSDVYNAMKTIAEYWGISYLDLRNDVKVPMGINGRLTGTINETAKQLRDESFKMSASNGHPNPKAHEYRSTIIEAWLRTL